MMSVGTLVLISILICIVAALYSSVGHGGASGYLAVLSFFAFAPATMSSTALVLNILVAGIALHSYTRAGHLSLKLSWPFILLSVPAAFLGGVLLIAAVRLVMNTLQPQVETEQKRVSLAVSLPIGAGIGLLSGVVGVGGGIFLSPIMILMRWADAKRTSATSALFIVVNSLAGLAGRFAKGGVQAEDVLPLILAAFVGGLVGSYYGANKFSGLMLRRVLSVVLVVAAVKMVITSW
jgi:uncharacterized membrane protein YfcA